MIRKILSKSNSTTLPNDFFFNDKGKCYSFLNPYGYNLMRKNQEVFNSLDVIFFDGVLLCIFYNFFYSKKIKRKSFDMTSIAKSLFEFLNTNNQKTIFFIGSNDDQIEKAVQSFLIEYPKLNVIGYRGGYFKDLDERTLTLNKITDLSPDFVIAGMGAIIQEKFIIDLKKSGYKGISFTCGGFFHQASQNLNFFPKWVNNLHLRSFYRLYKEKNTRKRFSKTIFNFPFNFIIDKFYKS